MTFRWSKHKHTQKFSAKIVFQKLKAQTEASDISRCQDQAREERKMKELKFYIHVVVPREKREIEELLYEKFLTRKWGTRNEKSIFFIFNQNLAFFDDFSKFQIVLSIFHFYKAGKNEKKSEKKTCS